MKTVEMSDKSESQKDVDEIVAKMPELKEKFFLLCVQNEQTTKIIVNGSNKFVGALIAALLNAYPDLAKAIYNIHVEDFLAKNMTEIKVDDLPEDVIDSLIDMADKQKQSAPSKN